MKKLLSVLTVLVLAATMFAGCGEKEPEVIKFGMLGPLSGDYAIYGVSVRDGAQLAIDEINAAGGINGKQVELVPYDSEGNPTKAISLFNKQVEEDGINALIGPTFSGESLTVGPIAEEKKIPMLSPTATNPEVTVGLDYVMRACYLDPYQGAIIAKFAEENLGAAKAVVFRNVGNDYAVGLADSFVAAFGGDVVADEGYTDEDTDFKAIITKIADLEPDVIFIPDYSKMAGLISSQIKEAGLDVALIGGDGWDGIQSDYPEVMEGQFFANHYVPTDEAPIVQNFVSEYEKNFDMVPTALAALGYDAAKIMAEAFDAADSFEPEVILEKLNATAHEGVTGLIKFDDQGDALAKKIVIIKIADGDLVLETKITQ